MKKTFEFGSGRLRGKVGVIAVGNEGKELKDLLGQFANRGDGRGNVVMVRVSDDAWPAWTSWWKPTCSAAARNAPPF